MNRRSPRLTVDLDALAANFRTLRAEAAGAEVAPVVKADAYGLGVAQVARRLAAEGAQSFFVARRHEGEALRSLLGPGATILVLDGCVDPSSTLTPVLNTPAQVEAWKREGDERPAALHVDTGLNRLGLTPDDLQAADGLNVALVLSHLACGASPEHPLNRRQRDRFAAVAARFPRARASLAASAGAFLGPDYRFDLVRPGIALYGGGPFERPHPKLRAVATLEAPILQLRAVGPDDRIGYGADFAPPGPMTVATVGVGYGDGVLRAMSPRGSVFLHGARRRIVGRVSMDLIVVDVTGCDAREGAMVELFGAALPVDEAAAAADAVAYELLSRLGPRVERVYRG